MAAHCIRPLSMPVLHRHQCAAPALVHPLLPAPTHRKRQLLPDRPRMPLAMMDQFLGPYSLMSWRSSSSSCGRGRAGQGRRWTPVPGAAAAGGQQAVGPGRRSKAAKFRPGCCRSPLASRLHSVRPGGCTGGGRRRVSAGCRAYRRQAYRRQAPSKAGAARTKASACTILRTSFLPVPRVVLAHGCCGGSCAAARRAAGSDGGGGACRVGGWGRAVLPRALPGPSRGSRGVGACGRAPWRGSCQRLGALSQLSAPAWAGEGWRCECGRWPNCRWSVGCPETREGGRSHPCSS